MEISRWALSRRSEKRNKDGDVHGTFRRSFCVCAVKKPIFECFTCGIQHRAAVPAGVLQDVMLDIAVGGGVI